MSSKNDRRSQSLPFWNVSEYRAYFYQFLVVAVLVFIAWYLISNTLANLENQHIATGFGFLDEESAFEIGETLIPFSAMDTYALALLAGFLNTLKVGVTGIVLTIFLGTFMGIARLSKNGLIAGLAALYIELFRNVPVLLQLIFWYALFHNLPGPRQALHPVSGVVVCNRGLMLPFPHLGSGELWVLGFSPLILTLWWWLVRKNRHHRECLGRYAVPPIFIHLLPVIILAGVDFFTGASWDMGLPVLKGFNFHGGITLTPEFAALLLGLVIYTGTFVAEIVRSGILAVDNGQVEAAKSIGLSGHRILFLVVLPQALRVIIPPLTSQMLNLVKNSTLAVAVGYPDLVSVANTTLNQTGQAIEAITIILVVYLVFSLLTSAFMNWFNKRSMLPVSKAQPS
jgi:general L-amino acid transport system permease protein